MLHTRTAVHNSTDLLATLGCIDVTVPAKGGQRPPTRPDRRQQHQVVAVDHPFAAAPAKDRL